MSKFPNHGLLTRTAAASTRSSSLIAQARRGAYRRRAAAIATIATLPPPTTSVSSSSGGHHNAPQPSAAHAPFVGPLTLAASQSTSAQHPTTNSSVFDTRSDASASPSSVYSHNAGEPRWVREAYADHVLAVARASDAQSRATVHHLDTDFTVPSALALLDASLQQPAHPHILAYPSSPSATLTNAARHLARVQPSGFPLSSQERIPVPRSTSIYALPHSRGIHIFYPSATASHALHLATSTSLDASCAVASLDSRVGSAKRLSQRSIDNAPQPSDYVPLWNVSAAAGSSSYVPAAQTSDMTSLGQRLDTLALLPVEACATDLFNVSAYDVPVTLLHSSVPSSDHDYQAQLRAAATSSNDATQEDEQHSSQTMDATRSSNSVHADQPDTASWSESDSSSSAWQSLSSPSSSSKSSKSSSSSPSPSSSRPPSPTISTRPHLATSSAKQDSSSGHGSGSSTPTQNNSLSPYQIENALLGPSSLLTTAAYARGDYDQHRGAAAAASDLSDVAHPSPLCSGSLASPKHRKLHYTFEHGAYGIPKRHPWAAVRGNGKRVQPTPKPVVRTGAVGMLAAAADFLTGSASPAAPAAPKEKLGGEMLITEDGRRLGLNSPIREHGRIVEDRLQSVQVGEDAYFLRHDSIGVADGVGGWASRAGADPALFSRLLMHFCAAELSKFDDLSADQLAAHGGKMLKEWEQLDPVEVMHTAWERCVRASRREGILGSSTALLAVLRGDELRIANLGDCVLLIIRAGELLFRSTEQQHSFNFPVQLGMMGHTAESVTIAANRTLSRDGFLQSGASDDLDDNAPNPLGTTTAASMDEARKGKLTGSATTDSDDTEEAEWDEPRRDAGRWTVKVQRGDIIIVGSDGLVDNLFDEDIVEEVLKFAPPPESRVSGDKDDEGSSEDGNHILEGESDYRLPDDFCPQLVSEALCSRAKAVSEDSRAVSSPFQQRAMEEGLHYVGGKHDDISVVVAVVGDPSERLRKAGYSIGSGTEPARESEPLPSDAGRRGIEAL